MVLERWEPPGDKLEAGKSGEMCEAGDQGGLSLSVEEGSLLDAWVYEVIREVRVLDLTYGCFAEDLGKVSHPTEHSTVGTLPPRRFGKHQLFRTGTKNRS